MNVCVPICRVPKEKVVSEIIRGTRGTRGTVGEAGKEKKERAASIVEITFFLTCHLTKNYQRSWRHVTHVTRAESSKGEK